MKSQSIAEQIWSAQKHIWYVSESSPHGHAQGLAPPPPQDTNSEQVSPTSCFPCVKLQVEQISPHVPTLSFMLCLRINYLPN